MTADPPRIYLASRSPRRCALLEQIGLGFEQLLFREDPARGVDVDETPLPGEAPPEYALRISRTKAELGMRYVRQRELPAMPVLAADTAVVLDREIIGKPADAGHAAEILERLSGRTHQVFSAVAVAYKGKVEARLSISTVAFRQLSPGEIRRYAASREPLDKAGAYAIQGRAAAFIMQLDGSYSGVMGLPLFETTELLRQFGIEVL